MKISKPKFLLKDPKSDSETLISLFVRWNNIRLVYSTGEKINPKNWDFKNQRAVGKKNLEVGELNFWLDKIENEVNSIFRNLKIDGVIPTASLVKEKLSAKLNDKPDPTKINLLNYIEKYMSSAKSIKRDVTIETYNYTLNHLLEYSKKKNYRLDFDTINMDFYNGFIKYLTIDLKHSLNTISKHIKTIKVFMNAATEEGINTNLVFRSKKFKRPAEEVTKIYLNTIEIDLLYALDLSGNLCLDKVRDLFIIACSTGLRFSDFSQLKAENIQEGLIKLKTQKTRETVMIPLNNKVKNIISKYDGNFPTSYSNQKMNEYLKDLGVMANINDEIIISKSKCGEKTDEVFKKHELITCHTARRSFVTNAIIMGIPTQLIMKITGHKTEKSFNAYVRFSNEDNAIKLKEHKFFN